MSTTPATNLYTALLNAQRQMGPLTKNAQNPHLRNKYADLTAVLNTIEQPLWDNGLIVVQRFNGSILITELIHVESGQKLTSEAPIACKDPEDPQKIGAAITYYRRYSLITLLGLSAEDDDGNAAAERKPAPRPAPTAAAPASGPLAIVGDHRRTRQARLDAAHKHLDAAQSLADVETRAAEIRRHLSGADLDLLVSEQRDRHTIINLAPAPAAAGDIDPGDFETIMADAAKLHREGKAYPDVRKYLLGYHQDMSEAQIARVQTYLDTIKQSTPAPKAQPYAGIAG